MNNRFAKNTIWILVGQVLKMLLSFIVNLFVARYLGPSDYGILNYVSSYLAFFTSLVGLGLNSVIIYELVAHRNEEGKILGTAIVLRFLVGLVSSFIFVFLIVVLDRTERVFLTVAILQAIQLPFLAFDTFIYWYQSKLLSKYAVIVQSIGFFITSVYKVLLIVLGRSVEWFAFSTSLDIILLAVMYCVMYYKQTKVRLGFSIDIGIRMLKKSGPFILANMMVFIYGQMDKIMLKQMLHSTEAVGLYSAAITICGLVGLIPTALLDSGRPVVMEAKATDETLYQKRFRQLCAGIIWVCFIYSMGMALFSKLAIRILYGTEYLGANTCLKIGVWYTAFSYVGSARSTWLICEKKEKYVFILSAMGAITNLLLNGLLIPVLGINGAAIATLATQVFANFVYPFFWKETREYSKCVFDAIFLRNVDIKGLVSHFVCTKAEKRKVLTK